MSLSLTKPITIVSLPSMLLSCRERYSQPPVLWPVSHTTRGEFCNVIHRPARPVSWQTLAKPSLTASDDISQPDCCRRLMADRMVAVLRCWQSPVSWPTMSPWQVPVYKTPSGVSVADVNAGWSCANVIGACSAAAFCSKTGRVSLSASPIMTGVPALMMPAFSAAICAWVSPKKAVWSLEMFVITHIAGLMMLVLSKRPPSPVSITAMSIFSLAKCSNAMVIVNSKNDGWHSRSMAWYRSTKSITLS